MPVEGKETKLGHSEKTDTGLGGGASSTHVGKRGFLVEPKPQEKTSPRRGTRDYTQHHTNGLSVGPRSLFEGLHSFGGLSIILFIDPDMRSLQLLSNKAIFLSQMYSGST